MAVEFFCEVHAQAIAHKLDLKSVKFSESSAARLFTCARFAVLKPVLVQNNAPNNAGHGNEQGQFGKNQASLS
jgi:hypothetical protein